MKTGNEDNVVRLPRDWLGPREDLIPFGPSAEAEAADAGLATPPSTHDFWGEAGTHVWEPSPDRPAVGSRHRARAGWVAPDALPRSIARLTHHPRAAWLSALAVSCVAIVIVAVSGSGSHHPAAAIVSRHAPATTAVAKLSPGRAVPSLQSRSHHRSPGSPARAGHRRAKPPAKHQVVHHTVKRPTRPATVQSVQSTAPDTNSGTTSSSSTQAASSSPASNAPAAAAASSSGSTSQPALGGAGALAPGSSPDS